MQSWKTTLTISHKCGILTVFVLIDSIYITCIMKHTIKVDFITIDEFFIIIVSVKDF